MIEYTFKMTPAVWRMNWNRIKVEIKGVVRRLFHYSRNE